VTLLRTWAGANTKSGGCFQSTSRFVLSECDASGVTPTDKLSTSWLIQVDLE